MDLIPTLDSVVPESTEEKESDSEERLELNFFAEERDIAFSSEKLSVARILKAQTLPDISKSVDERVTKS